MMSALCRIHPCLGSLGQMIVSCDTEDYCITRTVIHCLPLQHLGEVINVHRFLPPTLAGHAHSQLS